MISRSCALLIALTLLLAVVLTVAPGAAAEVVGRVTQTEGRVDILKAGKLPATPVKVNDPVQVGDVLRTKSLSKAQLTFMDNTVLTISPESRLAIEEYLFDPVNGKRNAVLQLFQGLAHLVVTKLFKVQEPDFLIKTHTAVMGVRGTELGIRLAPNSSTILNLQGLTQVANIFPEVGEGPFKRAHKIAFSFGKASVMLHDRQGTVVGRGLTPVIPFQFSAQDWQQFMQKMATGLSSRQSGKDSGTGQTGSGTAKSGGGGGTGSAGTGGLTTLTEATFDPPPAPANPIPLEVAPPPPPPPPVTPPIEPPVTPPSPASYTFQSIAYGLCQTVGASDGKSNQVNPPSLTNGLPTGWGIRTINGSDPTYFTYTSTGTNTWSQGNLFPTSSTGTTQSLISGTLTGIPGQNLTGPVTISSTDSFGSTITATASATLEPSGRLYYSYTGAMTGPWRTATISRDVISVPGTFFTQTLDGAGQQTATAPYLSQTSTSSWAGGWGGGSRTGVLPGNFAATLTGTDTSTWPYTYLPVNYNNFTSTMAGVVSPGTGSNLTGAVTIFPAEPDKSFTSSLPLAPGNYLFPRTDLNTPIVGDFTIQPSGAAFGTAYQTYYRDGGYESGVFNLTQTPQTSPVTPPASASYDFTQIYNGSMNLNSGPPGTPTNTLLSQGQGWGYRTGVYDGWFAAYKEAGWTLTSGSLPVNYGSAISVTQMSGRVTGILGQTLTGNMTFIGSLLGGTSFSYSGPVTIDNGGYLSFNYTGSWISPTGSGTAAGKLNQYSGYYFTQSLAGDYQLNSTNYNPGTGGYANATLTLAQGASGPSGSRTGVDPGTIGSFSGNFDVYSPNSSLPASSSGSVSVSAAGVVGTSELGAKFGAATYTLVSPFNISLPGYIGITPSGGSFFDAGLLFVTPTVQLNSATILTPSTLFNFSQTYNGFRIGTSSAPFSLASIEGYGWGLRTSSSIPANYLGYYISQDLGTRAAASGVLTPNWLSVTGTMSARVSGALGSTLSGTMTFTGSTSTGTTFTYQGNVALAPDGRLTFMYGGNATTSTGQPITASGTIQQVPGTYFTESGSGNLQLTTTTSGSLNVGVVKDTATLTGSRTMGGTTTPTTASFAAVLSSPNPLPGAASGPGSASLQGVVAGATWETKWGVATAASPEIGVTITGPVTIDTNGKLLGQFVDQANNASPLPPDKVSMNLVSVPTGTGQVTSSFSQTASGTFNQVASGDGSSFTLTTPTQLTGTSNGLPVTGLTNADLKITATASAPGSFGNATGQPITVTSVGAVGGLSGGVLTGAAATQVVKTISGTVYTPSYVGTAALQPGGGSLPPTLTTTLNSVINVPPATGASATHTGTLTTTPKP